MTVALIEELDDRTLVEQHRAGDDDAFRHIVLRHHRSLYANALRRLGDPVLAEDAVQETFLRAFRNLHRFDGDYHLDAWLHRIVTNACHDIGRRRGRDTRLFDRACTAVEVEAPAADDRFEVLPDHDVGEALDQLPETYREVLLLRFVDEMSYSDVAEKAGITEENARARVSRGRNMLKRMMTSASGLVIWAIAPLRRAQMQVQDPDAASQAAQQVQNLTGLTNVVSVAAPAAQSSSALTNLVAQAGPAIANVGPAVTSAGPGVKAAVAAGLAAAVAIPTGVAVDRAMDKPVPQTAAPLLEDDQSQELAAGSVDSPITPVTDDGTAATIPADTGEVGAASAGTPVVSSMEPTPVGEDTSTGEVDSTTPTTEPTDEASAPTTTTPTTAPPPPTTAPPAVGPSGDLQASGLAVTESGRHLAIEGSVTIDVGDATHAGQITGKLTVGAPGKDPEGPREVKGDLLITLDDGTQVELDFLGTATVHEDGTLRLDDLVANFSLDDGATVDLASTGELQGSFESADGAGTLGLTLPGRSS